MKSSSAVSKLKVIEPLTAEEFDEYYYLRWKILRKPWNQSPGSETDLAEEKSIHAMIMNGDRAMGVCRMQFNDSYTAQIRYMAVDSRYQKLGLGRKLIMFLEQRAIENHRHRIYLDARENAVEFYESCGYKVIKTSYLLFGEIQHYGMEKLLY